MVQHARSTPSRVPSPTSRGSRGRFSSNSRALDHACRVTKPGSVYGRDSNSYKLISCMSPHASMRSHSGSIHESTSMYAWMALRRSAALRQFSSGTVASSDGFPKRPRDPGDLIRSSRQASRPHLEPMFRPATTTSGMCARALHRQSAQPCAAVTARHTIASNPPADV